MLAAKRKGPSPEAVERINIGLVLLYQRGPLYLAEWSRACAPFMTHGDFKAVRIRALGGGFTESNADRKIQLTPRGRDKALRSLHLLAELREAH